MKIQTIQNSVLDNQGMIYEGKEVLDWYSANAVLAIYNALTGEAKAKLAELVETNLPQAVSICFKLINKQEARA